MTTATPLRRRGSAATVVAELRRRGELWEPAPGLLGLRGDAQALHQSLQQALGRLARAERADEWTVPAALPLAVLQRAEYFASFPQWLTLASHLGDDRAALGRVAMAKDEAAVRDALAAPRAPAAALPPAVCYHVYAALAGTTLPRTVQHSAQGCCWRHEGDRHEPLARGWSFTMREVVCLGAADETEAFRLRARARALGLAGRLGLRPEIVVATDPFFAPSARGRALLQRLRALKHELLLPIGDGRTVAAASFNHHDDFFGRAFALHAPDGSPAATACAAFGVERWMLALLVEHGTDARAWPVVEGVTSDE